MARVVISRLFPWAGFCPHPDLIFIRPERAEDKPLLAHEMVHAQQMRTVGILKFWWRYLTSRGFRLEMEIEAYKKQLSMIHNKDVVDLFAIALSKHYRLGISAVTAKKLLLAP